MRVNISLSEEVLGKIDKKANELHQSRSGFISMCVANYFDAQSVTNTLPDILETLKTLQKQQKKAVSG